MVEDRGTPRELADRLSKLPEGRYRLFIQPIRSMEESLVSFDETSQKLKAVPPPETANMTDDDVLEFAESIIQDTRKSFRTGK